MTNDGAPHATVEDLSHAGHLRPRRHLPNDLYQNGIFHPFVVRRATI